MDALNIIYKNSPFKEEYDEDNSFAGKLYEYCIWDTEEYCKLEWAIYFIHKHNIRNEDLFRIFFDMQEKVITTMLSHFIKHDVVKIVNLKNQQIIEYNWRISYVIRSYIMNYKIKINSLDGDIVNPYLTDDLLLDLPKTTK